MINTTLCHIEKDGKYLMLHRTKKENDLNHDKWIGIGGKFEDKESPEECNKRETLEETGLTLNSARYCGIVTFVSDKYPTEYMHIFHSKDFFGNLKECDEGELCWVDKNALYSLPIWQGDKIFLKLIEQESPFFSLKLEYKGETLVNAVLDGRSII
ncbi:MAG: 8-oxo-dGTP diphosphatase [Acutalibacteraceae bacterium]|jgi:8-oxo-dGTP diphosphatase|nr:8-oxo-dGTP diphosphatase [Acutalibacteraceae bacterium]